MPKFEGKTEALIRKKVMQALKAHGYELVKSREMGAAISSTGASLSSDDGVQSLAKELALSAVITGEIGARRAKIVVRDGSEGSVLGETSFAGANPRKVAIEVGRDFWRKLGGAVGRGHVPSGAKKAQKVAAAESPEDSEQETPADSAGADDSGGDKDDKKAEAESPPPSDADEKPKSDEPPPDEAEAHPHKKGKGKKGKKAEAEEKPKKEEPPPEEAEGTPSPLPWLDLDVTLGGLFRSLTYNQNISAAKLLPYTLGPGPVAVIDGVLYLLQPFMTGPAADFGLDGHFMVGFGISSQANNGTNYTNVVHDFAGGVRYRIGFAGTDQVYFSVTGGEDAFTFTGANRQNLQIPDTIYHYARIGTGLKVSLSPTLWFGIGGGYRLVLNKGGTQLGDHFFPNLTVAGADATLQAGYALTDNIQILAGVEWRRYWFNMHSKPGDTYIAGGALDQSFAVTVGAAFVFGGAPLPAEAPSEEAPPPPKPKDKKKRKHHDDSDEDSSGDSSSGDSGGGGGASGGDENSGDSGGDDNGSSKRHSDDSEGSNGGGDDQ